MRLAELIKAAEETREQEITTAKNTTSDPQEKDLFNTRKYQYQITR